MVHRVSTVAGNVLTAKAGPQPVAGPVVKPLIVPPADDIEDDFNDEAAAAPSPSRPSATEPTLHELNVAARKIDREHEALRVKAKAAAEQAAATELRGVAQFYRSKRLQKPLRPPVRPAAVAK